MMRVSDLRMGGMVAQPAVQPVTPVTPMVSQHETAPVAASEQTQVQADQERQSTPEDLRQAVDDMNKTVRMIDERLEFSVHKATNTVVVKVVDQWTKQVIKEIPPEKFLDLVAKLQELAGLFIDQRV